MLRREIVEHFQALKPNKLQRIPYSDVPDELNFEQVIEVVADPALIPHAKIYETTRINERDTLWGVLMDISGSTGGNLQSGEQVIELEKCAAGIVYQALTDEDVDDRVLLYAFSTGEYTHLYEFTGLENLGALKAENGNADGVAIRGVISEMIKVDAKDKKLIVISDGKPVATGSTGDPVIDTARAFGEAEDHGIRTMYINVDNSASEYFGILTEFCTYARSIRNVNQLPLAIHEAVLKLG